MSSNGHNNGVVISTRPPAPPAPPEPSPSLRSVPLPPMPMYQMPSITPYNRVTPHCMPSSSSVPLPAPPVHTLNGSSRNRGNRNRTFSSRKPYEIATQTRRINKTYKLSVELVMYPYDVSPHFYILPITLTCLFQFIPSPAHIQDGLSIFDESADINITCPDRLPCGEAFAAQLRLFSQYHCTRRIELHVSNPNELVIDQIYQGVHTMMNAGSLQFPTYSDMNFDLDVDEENRDIRIQYARLPFRLLVPGNRSKYGRALNVDCEDSWHRYSFSSLSKLAKRVDHPSGFGTGILLLCMSAVTCSSLIAYIYFAGPKEGAIIGPISPGSTEKHSCFVDHIHHFLNGGDAGTAIPCRLLCPHVPSHTSRIQPHRSRSTSVSDIDDDHMHRPRSCSVIDSDINDDLDDNRSTASYPSPIDLTESPVIIENSLPDDLFSRSQPTRVSPGLQLLNLNPPPSLHASQPPVPTTSRTIYTPSQPPSLIDLAVLDRDVRASGPELLRNTVWHVRSESLEVTVKGLLAFIIQARHHPGGPFHAPPDLASHFTLIPNNVRLHEVWTMHWLFRAYVSI